MKTKIIYIIFFSLFVTGKLAAQINVSELYNKKWKTKYYGVKFLTKTFNIYHQDSTNNPLDYVNKTFIFSDSGKYIGKDEKTDSIYHGKWVINSKGDSITFDGKRKYLNLLDANNLITSLSYLQYADTSGKVDTVVYFLHLYSTPIITSVEREIDHSYFVVFPNPTSSECTIRLSSGTTVKEVDRVRLLNLLGQPVKEQTISDVETSIDLRSLQNGIYFIEVVNKKNVVVGKKHIIKQ